jgi:hypothetical protein
VTFAALEASILVSSSSRFGSGVSDDVVDDAERTLGLAFPASYRWWLQRFGAGYLRGYALNGLFPIKPSERDPDEKLVGDVVATALLNRQSGMPRHLLELINFDGDEIFLLDLAQSLHREAPVVIWTPSSGSNQPFAPTFGDFLHLHL